MILLLYDLSLEKKNVLAVRCVLISAKFYFTAYFAIGSPYCWYCAFTTTNTSTKQEKLP